MKYKNYIKITSSHWYPGSPSFLGKRKTTSPRLPTAIPGNVTTVANVKWTEVMCVMSRWGNE